MPMDAVTFGQLALQLISAAQVPGGNLDEAIAFRNLARDLAEGSLTIQPAEPEPDEA